MSSSEKIEMYRDFAAGVYLSEAQKPLLTLHCVHVYCILIHTEGGGGS